MGFALLYKEYHIGWVFLQLYQTFLYFVYEDYPSKKFSWVVQYSCFSYSTVWFHESHFNLHQRSLFKCTKCTLDSLPRWKYSFSLMPESRSLNHEYSHHWYWQPLTTGSDGHGCDSPRTGVVYELLGYGQAGGPVTGGPCAPLTVLAPLIIELELVEATFATTPAAGILFLAHLHLARPAGAGACRVRERATAALAVATVLHDALLEVQPRTAVLRHCSLWNGSLVFKWSLQKMWQGQNIAKAKHSISLHCVDL